MTRGRFSRTAQAEEDLIDIWSYIAADNARAADRLLDTLDEKSQLLADNPGLGVERPEIAPDVRSWRVGSYLILYRKMKEWSRDCTLRPWCTPAAGPCLRAEALGAFLC